MAMGPASDEPSCSVSSRPVIRWKSSMTDAEMGIATGEAQADRPEVALANIGVAKHFGQGRRQKPEHRGGRELLQRGDIRLYLEPFEQLHAPADEQDGQQLRTECQGVARSGQQL